MGTEGRTRTWAEWAQEYQVYIAVVLANWTAWIEGILKSLRPKGPQIGPAEPVDVLEVAEGFKNRVVLLTGASGYLGSLILELLLRTCPDVAKVYVIMRAKAGRNGRERLLKILQGPLFQKFHSQLAEIEDKVVVITADLTAPGAGLTPVDRARLASEVHYIIHCAADIRFTLNLVESLRANYAPTQTLLELAAEAPKLRCFTYVSTAYVNSDLAKGETVKEILYADAITRATKKETNDATRARVLDLLMKVNQTKAATQSAKLLKASGLANPYMLAKNFTERLVMASDRKPFPVCIVRPSGIGAVAREPYPGYIGNPSGLTAFILAAAAGAIKASDQSAYSPSSVMGLVPAECVSSTVLAATIAVAEGEAGTQNIYHVCSSITHPISLWRAGTAIQQYLREDPPSPASAALLEGWSKAKDEQLQWHDYDLRFDTAGASALQRRLTGRAEAGLQCIWPDTQECDWTRYFRTYAAGTKHIYLRDKPKKGLKDQDYVP